MSVRKQTKRSKNAKKYRNRGIIAAVIGTSLLIAFIGILVPPVSLSADGIFPGIQTVVNEKVSSNQSYRILEVVPDGAIGEIGYLVEGSEPYAFQDRMAGYIADTEPFVNTSENRKNYIELLAEQLRTEGLLGEDKPLDYKEYKEEYFPEDRENASWIKFPEGKYELLEMSGYYERNTSNEGMYQSNIVSFTYNEQGDYSVNFKEGVKKSEEAPYNQPYELTTNGTIMPVETIDESRLNSYYYIDSFSYEGTASSNSSYTAVLDAQKPYSYVGEGGNFDFYPQDAPEEGVSPSETNQTYQVEVGQVAYTGGIINRNWFKSQILNASDVDGLDVEVISVSESELAATDFSNIDFLYICNPSELSAFGTSSDGTKPDCARAVQSLLTMVTEQKLPCMIDSVVREAADRAGAGDKDHPESDIYELVRLAESADSVKSNIYCINTTSSNTNERQAFFADWTDIIQPPASGTDSYEEVRQLIRQENMFRSGEDLISKDISKITVIQYIINCRNARAVSAKESLRVLDIEPAMGNLYLEGASIDAASGVLTSEKLAEWTGVAVENISITRMTSAEFIGKTEDLNTQYDLVYFGLGYNGDYMNRDASGRTVYNDSYMDGLVYTHVGDAVLRPAYLAGLLDTDYVNNNTSNYFYGPDPDNSGVDAYGYRNQYSEAMNKLVANRTTINNFRYENPSSRRSSRISVTVGNVGVYRYSGNDITKTKLRDLKEYAGANYPILFGEGFLKADNSLNDEVVDNSSVLYEFMGCGEGSIFFVQNGSVTGSGAVSEDSSEQMDFISCINMPKPKLVLYSPTSDSLEVPEETTIGVGEEYTAENSYGNKVMQIDAGNASRGTYTIRMRFQLDSTVDVDASTRYIPRLYLDLNADGKFVENGSYSDLIHDISIRDEAGAEAQKQKNGENEEYLLKSGTVYTLEKDIPSEYRGMLTWKLELCQSGNDRVRTSKIGYTVVSRGSSTQTIETVNVLQIMGERDDWGGKWKLADDSDIKNYISDFAQKEGIHFVLNTTTTSEFSKSYRYREDGADDDMKNIKNYSMLIFGFQDSYTDITNADALDGIDKFINSGKSVLFTHDNSSFVNVDKTTKWAYDVGSDSTTRWYETEFNRWDLGGERSAENHRYWGYNINQRLRDILGMDRFGITHNDHTAQDQTLSRNRSELLKQGQLLDITESQGADGNTTITGSVDTSAGAGGIVTRGLASAELGTDKDIAYVVGSGRKQSYGETQGYSTGAINFQYYVGAPVAKYRFKGTAANGFNWNKYMELNVAQPGPKAWEECMGQVGQMHATQLNDGQITHYPYEIGEDIEVSDTHYQWWQLNMDQDFDQDGESDIVVWYCLSSDREVYTGTKNMYTESPNDARNNYYIYSIGNIMYSGVGHSTVTKVNEKKLFFNTIVAAYKLGIKSPSVTVLESEDRNAREKTVEYLPFDESMGTNGELLDDEVSFYYTVSDPNLVSSTKQLYVDYSFADGGNIAASKRDNDVYITTQPVGGKTLATKDDVVTGLRSGTVYKATIHNLDSATVKSKMAANGSMSVQIRVRSTFTYYGDTYGFEAGNKAAPSATTSIMFQKRTLFDLD